MLLNFEEVDGIIQDDIVIVGAGTVGILMAVALARKGRSVTLLEAGNKNVEAKSQRYFEQARNIGNKLDGLHVGRFRCLGGTSLFWGGQLVRFDPIAFGQRPWVRDDAHWPISRKDIDPYYDECLRMLGMDAALTDDATIAKKLKISLPPTGDDLDFFFTRWTPNPNFASVFYKDIMERPNLRVILNAPVTAFTKDTNRHQAEGLIIRSPDGRQKVVKAKTIVLANGTFEIARLLAMPYSDGTPTPWNGNAWIGRGFMDHVDLVAGKVVPLKKADFHNIFDNAVVDKMKYQPKLKLSEKAQRDRNLMGISCHMLFNSSISENIDNAKIFFKAFLRGKMECSLRELPSRIYPLLRVGLPMMLRYIRSRRIYNPADLGCQLRLTSEQRMVAESGIRLREERDDLGMPLIDVDWKIDANSIETLAQFAEVIRDYLQSTGLATVHVDPRLLRRESSIFEEVDDANHQMGMARMSNDPAMGVVNSDLCVHGTNNVYVSGAAVFPSTGFPNPTFTSLALGLRLADHLDKQGRL